MPEGKIDYLTAVRVGRSVHEPDKRVEVIRQLAEKHLPVEERAEVIRKVVLEPERPVEEVIKEVEEAPFVLQFTAINRKPLVEGKKTQTSMTTIPDQKIKAGAIVHAAIWEPRIVDLRITSVERKRLKYFDEDDAKREGGYTLEQFKKVWKEEHEEWDEDQLVYVVHFEKTN